MNILLTTENSKFAWQVLYKQICFCVHKEPTGNPLVPIFITRNDQVRDKLIVKRLDEIRINDECDV